MKNKAKVNLGLRITLHVIFWVIVMYLFLHFSFLRPGCGGKDGYKEIISAAIICVLAYFNYFITIPKLFFKRKYFLFWIVVVLSILLSGIVETLIVKKNVVNAIANSISTDELSLYLQTICLLVSLRNASFMSFVFISKNYKRMKNSLLDTQQRYSKETNHIILTLAKKQKETILIKDITYISCNKNKSSIHLFDSTVYSQYESLSHYESLIPENQRLRINRNTLIMYKYVVDFGNTTVTMLLNGGNKLISFVMSSAINNALIEKLNFYTKSSENNSKKNYSATNKKDENGIFLHYKEDEFCTINTRTQPILEEISKNPGQNKQSLLEQFHHISTRTLSYYLKELKDSGRIEYRGSKRTGGYFAVTKEEVTTS